jgi:FlaA1/EpsC-like NDP-sugar epimerase
VKGCEGRAVEKVHCWSVDTHSNTTVTPQPFLFELYRRYHRYNCTATANAIVTAIGITSVLVLFSFSLLLLQVVTVIRSARTSPSIIEFFFPYPQPYHNDNVS